ncbi:MAG: GNAT family N-acetyltransferase [Alphaproteobacteria bacterium]|nr:GNAT family N-acetyltransferase [Alphaproteobacteria bacterium]
MNAREMAEIHALCFRSPRPWRADEFADLLRSNGVFACTRAAGLILGRLAGPEAEILTLAVAPSAQRQGIANELLDEFERIALEQGAVQLFLEVANTNHGAIALYRKHQYRDAGIRKDYYASPRGAKVSALVMSKPLEPLTNA